MYGGKAFFVFTYSFVFHICTFDFVRCAGLDCHRHHVLSLFFLLIFVAVCCCVVVVRTRARVDSCSAHMSFAYRMII